MVILYNCPLILFIIFTPKIMSLLFLFNTVLGFLIAQLSDLLKRSKDSENSPTKFSFVFFIKDNWEKITFSLMLSLTLSIFVALNFDDFLKGFFHEFDLLNNIIYGVIGFAPEIVLQYAKKKYGFLQPSEVTIPTPESDCQSPTTYIRK